MSSGNLYEAGSPAEALLHERYLARGPDGIPIEDAEGLFRRVAGFVAAAGGRNDGPTAARRAEEYGSLMSDLRFLPNSPTLMNAGTPIGQLSACFVLPIEDSLESIFQAVKDMALIHRTGGGTGFSFSRLRAAGDLVATTGSPASGPISFMEIFDAATSVVRQGGRRRGANMAILSVHHPDIADFIFAKTVEGRLENFNISVSLTDEFIEAVKTGGDYPVFEPGGTAVRGRVPAAGIMQLLVANAWRSGEPGVVFIDAVNRANPTPRLGRIESTNPCGEQPLLPYESCNLGSINLAAMTSSGQLDESRLEATVRLAVRFLDDVVDANTFVIGRIAEMTKANRKIGLGVMGFADMLIALGIRYDSPDGLALARSVMGLIAETAHDESRRLASELGAFPNFAGSIWEERGLPPQRNATLTTIAPTGSLSILAGCSSGIEPLYALSYKRRGEDGSAVSQLDGQLMQRGEAGDWLSPQILEQLAMRGSVADMDAVPAGERQVFRTALDIEPADHVRMQAAFQEKTDNAVSKTVNLPAAAGPAEVEGVFMLAYELGCKGVTVYRSGSRSGQVLSAGEGSRPAPVADMSPTGPVCTESHCG